MNDDQEDKLSMYYAVEAAAAKHEAAWQTLPAFVTHYASFTGAVETIRDTIDGQFQGISGAAQDKADRRLAMARLAFPVSAAVQAWALENDDAELADRIAFTLTDFLHDRDTLAEEYAQLVHDEADARVADLADYGIDAARLTALADAIADYHVALTAPREAITDRKAATAALKTAFAAADDILKNRLDKLIPILALDHPAFATDWGNARIIVNTGGGGGSTGGGGGGNGEESTSSEESEESEDMSSEESEFSSSTSTEEEESSSSSFFTSSSSELSEVSSSSSSSEESLPSSSSSFFSSSSSFFSSSSSFPSSSSSSLSSSSSSSSSSSGP